MKAGRGKEPPDKSTAAIMESILQVGLTIGRNSDPQRKHSALPVESAQTILNIASFQVEAESRGCLIM